jgi:hypothetical protein
MTESALGNQLALLQMLGDISVAADAVAHDPTLDRLNAVTEMISGLQYPVRAIEFADDDEQQMELLRTLEIHGEGLRPRRPDDKGFQPNDLLIAQDRTIWMVVAVDKDGAITKLAGSTEAKKPDAQSVQFTWRPDKHARVWLRQGETVAPGYADINKAFLYLVRLWGDKTVGGDDLTTPIGFFRTVVSAPGVSVGGNELETFAELDDVVSFCNARGGLADANDSAKATTGDLVLMNQGKIWGLVTRTSPDGAIEDVLAGGMPGTGDLKVPPGAVKLVRGVQGIEKIWRPTNKRP